MEQGRGDGVDSEGELVTQATPSGVSTLPPDAGPLSKSQLCGRSAWQGRVGTGKWTGRLLGGGVPSWAQTRRRAAQHHPHHRTRIIGKRSTNPCQEIDYSTRNIPAQSFIRIQS